jgi:hypothetical protein
MTFHPRLLRLRDHLAALAASIACAHVIGLVRLVPLLPQADLLIAGRPGQLIGVALSALVHALVLSLLYRRRLVAGPLYRCGATRAAEDYGRPYRPGTSTLLQGWHYR